MRERWEADERPEPRSLGLLPSGPDPVGEWLVHRQPPACISAQRNENASGGEAWSTAPLEQIGRASCREGVEHSGDGGAAQTNHRRATDRVGERATDETERRTSY